MMKTGSRFAHILEKGSGKFILHLLAASFSFHLSASPKFPTMQNASFSLGLDARDRQSIERKISDT